MLIVCNSKQEIVARLVATPGVLLSRSIVVTSDDFKAAFRALRDVPRNILAIDVNYPLIGAAFHPLNKDNPMDIENIVQTYESKNRVKKAEEELKQVFIAPVTAEMPSDGVLNYLTVETVYDLKDVPDRSVVLVRPDQLELVRCIADNTVLFKVRLATLTGLPTADYSVGFDEVTWAFDKVAYAPFISELRVAGEIEAQLASQNRTQHDIERAKYTRKSGLVKEHSNFTVAKLGSDGDDDIADDEAPFAL